MNKFQRFIVSCFNVLYPCKVHGRENIPEGGVILACNHFRAIDCGFVADVCYKDTFFLAKKELFKNKFLAGLIKWFGGIPVDREKPDLKMLMSTLKLLKDGKRLVIFPEGTRNKSGTNELQELKDGTAFFAVKAKCPIVPMMISRKAKIFRKTHIIVGKPFDFSEYYGKKLTAEDEKAMNDVLREKMVSEQNLLNEILTKKKNKKSKNR